MRASKGLSMQKREKSTEEGRERVKKRAIGRENEEETWRKLEKGRELVRKEGGKREMDETRCSTRG